MLSKLPASEHIFIDANIFIYHFLGLKESCSEFLLRVENKEIFGYTSVTVLLEVCHRLMIAEAIETYNLTPRKAVTYLKRHPQSVQQLTRCHEAITYIPQMKIKIWNLSRRALFATQLISRQYGMLTNDSINLALINQHKIKNIATNDKDFVRVKEIKVWKPS